MKYVDLFAGCGGLSLGIERAGGQLVVAVEKSDMAARTFYHNLVGDAADPLAWQKHVGASTDEQVAKKVLVKELSSLLSEAGAMQSLADLDLDLVVGGPPCQGFSLAGRRNPDDVRNKLPWEYLEFVATTRPKAVVIENVVGMSQKFDAEQESSFVQLQQALADIQPGYIVQGVHVNAMHYGAPQHRPRLMIIGIRSDVALRTGVQSTGKLWKSGFKDVVGEDLPRLAPVPTVESIEARTVGHAIADLSPHAQANGGNKLYVKEMKNRAWGVRTKTRRNNVLNHVPRKHAQRTQDRFRMYQYLSNSGLDQRIISRAAVMPISDAELYVKKQLVDAPLPAIAPDGTLIAETVEALGAAIISLATKKHSQKVLSWASPARTVVTLPDDYVHPVEPRIFTVREMARFQGFPEDFEFLGKETTGAHRRRVEVPQYSQVGNAVSPWLSLAVGKMISNILSEDANGESYS